MKIDISEINKLKLESIRKTENLKDLNDSVSMILSTYIKTLDEEKSKKLIEAL